MSAFKCVIGWVVMVALVVRAPWAWAITNVVLMIGDGMGPEHVRAASWFAHGRERALFMESLPHRAEVVTCPAYRIPPGQNPASVPAKVTDSAAAATAMATGRKVFNGVLSLALPGDGSPLETILERYAKQGRKTGLVSTAHLTDATPAAFASHVRNRSQSVEIWIQMVEKIRPDLLLGGRDKNPAAAWDPAKGHAGGYCLVTNRTELWSAVSNRATRILGLFSDGGPMCYEYDFVRGIRSDYSQVPHLSEMAQAALEFLSQGTNGFFLMIEGACIDKASHRNELERMVHEVVEFDRAVARVVDWARARGDTLVLVTADHECGGLKVVEGASAGQMPKVTWASRQHTGVNVELWAVGPGAERVQGLLDNTDIYRIMMGTFTGPTRYVPEVGTDEPKEDGKD